MRLVIFFDLPTETKQDLKEYRMLIKFLKENGYIRIQYSIYCKLCINTNSVITAKKKFERNVPISGDIRYLILSENQYLSIKVINSKFNLNEKVTNQSRLLIIGGDCETESG